MYFMPFFSLRLLQQSEIIISAKIAVLRQEVTTEVCSLDIVVRLFAKGQIYKLTPSIYIVICGKSGAFYSSGNGY